MGELSLTDAVGTWTSLTDPEVAEIAAGAGRSGDAGTDGEPVAGDQGSSVDRSGFDFVVVDTEHAPLGLETVGDCLRAVEANDGRTVVRVPWNDHVRIKRLLDLGPDGLLVPMVDTAEEARDAVSATRYPPAGRRGVAAGRAAGYGRRFEAYVREGHRELTLVVQIETASAVENAAAIAGVEGVDALFVGPADLSASLDVFAEWTDPTLLDAIERVLEAGADAGVPVGTLATTPEQVRALGSLGFDFLVAGVDVAFLVEGQRRVLDAAADVL